jgi:hypothetical protein
VADDPNSFLRTRAEMRRSPKSYARPWTLITLGSDFGEQATAGPVWRFRFCASQAKLTVWPPNDRRSERFKWHTLKNWANC